MFYCHTYEKIRESATNKKRFLKGLFRDLNSVNHITLK